MAASVCSIISGRVGSVWRYTNPIARSAFDSIGTHVPSWTERDLTMTVPTGYLNATEDFERFLLDARNESGLNTTNMAWNMVVGVLQVFRRRLAIGDAVRFANVLPPGIRSLFVADWDPDEKRRPFEDVAAMTEEVKLLRAAHNF